MCKVPSYVARQRGTSGRRVGRNGGSGAVTSRGEPGAGGVSLTITLPLDKHRLNAEESEIRRKGIEPKARARMWHGAPAASRGLGVELRYLLWGVVEILRVFPGISLYPVAFPLDQVLEFPSEHPTVQDLFHNILLFPIYEFRRRWRVPMSSDDQVVGSGRQLHNIKDRVKMSHRGRKDQMVGILSDASFNQVGA